MNPLPVKLNPAFIEVKVSNNSPNEEIAWDVQKWGYIDENEEVIIDYKYEAVSEFSGNYALVRSEMKWYLINTDGKILFTFNSGYDKLSFLGNGLLKAKRKKCGVINFSEEPIIDYLYDNIQNVNGFIVGNNLLDNESSGRWIDEGLNAKEYYAAQTNEAYIYSSSGKLLHKPEIVQQEVIAGQELPYDPCDYGFSFWEAIDYHNFALPQDIDGKVCFINSNGNPICAPIYDDYQIALQHAIVWRENLCGLLNKKGEEVLPIQFENIVGVDPGNPKFEVELNGLKYMYCVQDKSLALIK
jgi:hypothetical protein